MTSALVCPCGMGHCARAGCQCVASCLTTSASIASAAFIWGHSFTSVIWHDAAPSVSDSQKHPLLLAIDLLWLTRNSTVQNYHYSELLVSCTVKASELRYKSALISLFKEPCLVLATKIVGSQVICQGSHMWRISDLHQNQIHPSDDPPSMVCR